MLLSAVSVLVVAQSSSEVPEGLMNNPVYSYFFIILYNDVSTTVGVSQLQRTNGHKERTF